MEDREPKRSQNLEVQSGSNECDDDEIDIGPFLAYLESEKGHEIASRVLSIFEDIKKAALEKNSSHAKFEKWLQVGIVLFVITASSLLTYVGKFDSTVAVLFGTLVGYLFGKK